WWRKSWSPWQLPQAADKQPLRRNAPLSQDHNKPPDGGFFSTRQNARSVELFLEPCGRAGQGAQTVQPGLAHGAAALDGNAVNRRGEGLEGTLDANTAGDLAHGERGVQTPVALTDNHAFKGLQTLTIAFLYFYLNNYSVTRCEHGDFTGHLLCFELGNNVGHF